MAPPVVLVTRSVKGPLLTGFFHPAILLPHSGLPGGAESSREVLAHELGHLARGDCLWSLGCRIGIAVLFFQPLLWLLARRVEQKAEEVCDDYVVTLTSDRRSYARLPDTKGQHRRRHHDRRRNGPAGLLRRRWSRHKRTDSKSVRVGGRS